jgi:hypothetical protein
MSNVTTKTDAKEGTSDYHELAKQIGKHISQIDSLLRAYYKKYPVAEQDLVKWNILKIGKASGVETFFRKPHLHSYAAQIHANIATAAGVQPQEDMMDVAPLTGDESDPTIDTYSLVGAPPSGLVPTGPK